MDRKLTGPCCGQPPTKTVQWTRKQLQPYTKYVTVLAKPALTSFSIAFAAGESRLCDDNNATLSRLSSRTFHHAHHHLTWTNTKRTARLAARSSMAAMQGAHNTVFSDD